MNVTNPKSDFKLWNQRPDAGDPATASAWDALEHFLRDLQACDQTADQIRSALKAVRDSLRTDVVFWYPGTSADAVEVIGNRNVTPEWCKALTRQLLEETPGGDSQVLLPALPRSSGTALEMPRSAALVRISKSRNIWMVALSFSAERRFHPTDLKAMNLARRMLLNQRQHAQLYGKLKETLFGLIHCLTSAIEAKDPYTCGHSERVGRIAVRLAQQMGMPRPFVSDIYLAGLLHDIGKIGIRDSVLQKQGPLTDEDFAHVKTHVTIGDRIMAYVPQLQHLRPGVRNHHERFDGKGYPDGLAGEGIPLLARILAVADSCDAMMSARPYRRALPTGNIDGIMSQGRGTQWDPRVVESFLSCKDELYSICQQGIGDSLIAAVEHAVEAGNVETGRDLP